MLKYPRRPSRRQVATEALRLKAPPRRATFLCGSRATWGSWTARRRNGMLKCSSTQSLVRLMKKMNPEQNKLIWFIHSRETSISLGFIRTSNNGATIIGGKTGTHKTGHGESYWDKMKEIISQNYIPIDVARDLNILPSNWEEPKLNSEEKKLIGGKQQTGRTRAWTLRVKTHNFHA